MKVAVHQIVTGGDHNDVVRSLLDNLVNTCSEPGDATRFNRFRYPITIPVSPADYLLE